jgi:hypothetical protein
MTKINGTGVSLASLDARKASETPYLFEYVGPDGVESGIRLGVLGGQSSTVTKATNLLLNERRRQEAIRDAEANAARPGDNITPVESDILFGQRLAAIRLVAWEGIDEDCTPENALLLCQTNADIAAEVLKQSNKIGNFTKASRPA